jgi:hypothetical protein
LVVIFLFSICFFYSIDVFCCCLLSGFYLFPFFASYQEAKEGLEHLKLRTAEAALKIEEAERHWKALITPSGKGNGLSVPFEQYVRGILATGCSAKAARGTIAMSANVFLNADEYKKLNDVLPLPRWFQSQREGLGNEAWTYAMIRVAGAEKILQWGFDETKLDGVSTMNQWVLLQEGENS